MPRMIVDVYDEDGSLAETYDVTLDIVNAPVTENDFIEEAKANMREDGYSDFVIGEVTFKVRKAEEP